MSCVRLDILCQICACWCMLGLYIFRDTRWLKRCFIALVNLETLSLLCFGLTQCFIVFEHLSGTPNTPSCSLMWTQFLFCLSHNNVSHDVSLCPSTFQKPKKNCQRVKYFLYFLHESITYFIVFKYLSGTKNTLHVFLHSNHLSHTIPPLFDSFRRFKFEFKFPFSLSPPLPPPLRVQLAGEESEASKIPVMSHTYEWVMCHLHPHPHPPSLLTPPPQHTHIHEYVSYMKERVTHI